MEPESPLRRRYLEQANEQDATSDCDETVQKPARMRSLTRESRSLSRRPRFIPNFSTENVKIGVSTLVVFHCELCFYQILQTVDRQLSSCCSFWNYKKS